MPPAAKHRAEVVSRRRMAKRHVLPNERWLPLSSAENDLKSTIQASLFVISTCCLAMTQLLGLLLTLESTEDMGDVDYNALDTAIKSDIIIFVAYTGMLRTLRRTDSLLFDIPPEEENAPLQFTTQKTSESTISLTWPCTR